MKTTLALCSALIVLPFTQHAVAFTGCPGNGPTNSTVVVEYIFHEGSGSTAFNTGTGGDAGNATLTNGVTWSSDVPPSNAACGYSASLPNTGTGSTTPAIETSANYDPLAGATQFVIMAWVKRESATSNNNTAARIVSDTSSTSLTSTTAGVEFRFSGSAGTLALRVNGTELSTTVGGIAPNSNRWHHVAVVYDGSRPATNALTRHAHFYVDGIQRGLGVSNSTLNVSVNANTNRLTVGNSAVSRGLLNTLVGKIDDVRILRGFAPAAVGDGKTNEVILCYMNNNDDFEPPTITCPANRTVNIDPGQCFASGVALGTPTTGDNCGTVTVTNNAPATFPRGTTIVTWTVTDAAGNSTNCQQTVTVVDNEMPGITCPGNVTVEAGACLTPPPAVNLGQATATDNCVVSSITSNAPAQYVMGTNTVTWTVTDVAGNTAQCQQLVIVVPSATADCDGDGLPDWQEVRVYNTDPLNADTDGDGMSDGWEVAHGLNPNVSNETGQDTDGDGLTDLEEFTFGTNPNSAYFDQLAAWWKLDETQGATAHDSSGQANHGQLQNMGEENRVPGRWGNALSFNGSNAVVRVQKVAGSRLATLGEELTVAGWLKASSNDASGTRVMFSLGSQELAGAVLGLREGRPFFELGVSNETVLAVSVSCTNVVADEQWHHVAGVYSASRQAIVLYVDGRAAAVNESRGQSGAVANQGAGYIGAVATNSLEAVFAGLLDELRVFNAALSQQAIADLFDGKAVTGDLESGRVRHWTERSWLGAVPSASAAEEQGVAEDYQPPPLPDASELGVGKVSRRTRCCL